MKKKNNITGIILAGGKSSRMGNDKGFLLYKNKTFIQHIINALQPLVSSIIIVSDNPSYDAYGLKRVEDTIKEAGPLAGIYSGLNVSKTEQNLVLSCDVPLINTTILQKLIAQIDTNFDVVQLKSNEKTMPLIAVYKNHSKLIFLHILHQGERRLQAALEHLKVKTITLNKTEEKYVSNINTQTDLKKINKCN